MTKAIPFDDLAAFAVLVETGFGQWGQATAISAKQADDFARVTGVAAQDGMLPGCMLQSLLPRLVPTPTWIVEGHSGALNLGAPTTRFPCPVAVGASVQGRSRLAAAREHPRGTILGMEFEMREPGANGPCMRSLIEVLYLGGRP
ncbi:MAG: hypothetical protein H6918_00715 [Sphingomonadaceae bacterium]|nr:hypothetical protein [Sphingomonadaceae bacterium]